jgi:hypothetical protein
MKFTTDHILELGQTTRMSAICGNAHEFGNHLGAVQVYGYYHMLFLVDLPTLLL